MVVFKKIGIFFKKNWIRLIVAFIVGLILMTIYNVSNAAAGANSWGKLEYYRDGSFLAGMALFFFGLLVLVASLGAFDIFSFFTRRKKKDDGHKETYAEYVQRKNQERVKINFSFLSYIIVALAYILASLILFLVLKH